MKIALDEYIPGCRYFTWAEVLKLPQWNIHAYPDEIVLTRLILIANKLDQIRRELKKPINVTSGFRPKLYNALVNGSQFSGHIDGTELDFQVAGMAAYNVRKYLEPKLEDLDLYMEDHQGNWTHIGNRARSRRMFKP